MTPKVVVVMPAYNAGRTLRITYDEQPKEAIHRVILVDDGSTDETLDIARELDLEIFVHNRNYGYRRGLGRVGPRQTPLALAALGSCAPATRRPCQRDRGRSIVRRASPRVASEFVARRIQATRTGE